MEQFKRLGELCRAHYEKLILVLVLLLMGVAAWIIYDQSQKERNEFQNLPIGFETRKVKGVKPVDLQPYEKSLQAATNPPAITFGGNHNLFNPVTWIRYPGKPDMKVQTGQEVGPAKLQIVEIRPLALSIAYDRPAISGGGDQAVVTGYHMVMTNDMIVIPSRRRSTQFMTLNDTNKPVFVLMSVKGPADNPTEMVARLKDLNETITFAPGKPYVRVLGYEADLKYSLTGASFPNRRTDMPLTLESESYKIVDITENKVVLSDNSNGKRYTIEQTTTP